MNLFKRFKLWLKYRSHPCYLGDGEFDHSWKLISDSHGDGIYTQSITYAECENCDDEANDQTATELMDGYDDWND